jgi:trigger factor
LSTETADLKVSVENSSAWGRKLTITVPHDRVERERQGAAQRLAKQVRLPGFRKGKIPNQVMEKRFGQAIEQEAVEKAIGTAYRDALKQENLQPITQGSINDIHYHPGEDLVFHVELEVRPELELERIGGFTLRRDVEMVGDEQVEQVLQRLREEQATWDAVEGRTPLAGDMVDVEITPLDDHTEAAPSSPRRYQVVIGEGQAIPAIEDVLRTLRSGEAGEFDVELPENSEDPAAGTKPHRMQVRMLEVKQPQYAPLDDEFARKLGDFETLGTLRERVREDLQRENERETERRVRAQLLQELIAANPFDVPQSMVQQYVEAMLPAREGADPDKLAEARQSAWPMAEQALQRMLVIERVAELEALHAKPEEVQARVDELAQHLNRPAREVGAQLRKNGRLDEIAREITEDRVFDYLKSLSTIE